MTIDEDVFVKHKDILSAALSVGTAIVAVGQAFTWLQLEVRQSRIDSQFAQVNAKIDGIGDKVNAKIDGIGDKVDGMKDSLDRLEKRNR